MALLEHEEVTRSIKGLLAHPQTSSPMNMPLEIGLLDSKCPKSGCDQVQEVVNRSYKAPIQEADRLPAHEECLAPRIANRVN